MLKSVTKASEIIVVPSITVVVFGQPGVGKTSLASTAEAPLLLDFDRGAHRSAFRCDTIQIDSWSDVAGIERGDLDGVKTLIVDTAGRAVDFLIAALPVSEGKTAIKNGSGSLTLQGYGRLKDAFIQWLRRVNTFGVDIVLVCHDREERDGDNRIFRPDVTGGSYQEIVKVADFCGYIGKLDGRNTIIDFSPTNQWIGKNSAGLPPLIVPDFADEPRWFAGIMRQMKDALGNIGRGQKEATDKLRTFKDRASEADTIEALLELVPVAAELGKPLSVQAWFALKKHAKAKGFLWDQKEKTFKAIGSATEAA